MFKYLADFVFKQNNPDGSHTVRVLDYKGDDKHLEPLFKLKRKFVETVYDIKIEIVG